MTAPAPPRPAGPVQAPSGLNDTASAPQQGAALHQRPQPVASSSRNPQLGPDPYFAYPTPTPEQIEDELPPYWESENVPLGPLLDRLSRKGYRDLRTLVEKTLPPLAPRQKPKHIIEYAKTTRQAVLKYLAVLRWKTSVDLVTAAAASGLPAGPTASFPTPHSNGESNNTSPATHPLKPKPRGADDPVAQGKVTDARRIQHFLEHQNSQHQVAIEHIRHVTKLVETLRERNADLLTALSLQSTPTYTRLPTTLTDSFIPRPPLNPPAVLDTVERLNEHLLYRLRCVDYIPPELIVEKVADGRVHVRGGGAQGWRAQLSVVGFEDDSRWWLTGVEWLWGSEGSHSQKAFSQEERQQILDLANLEVLAPRPVPEPAAGSEDTTFVDSPLVRVVNLLQHLSLAYQLEVLFSQAMILSQGRWRGQLLVDTDRAKKELRVRYWTAKRTASQQPSHPAAGKRTQPPSSLGTSRGPLVGGTLTFSLAESSTPISEADKILRETAACGVQPTERAVNLEIRVQWEVGEAGVGGSLTAGEAMDPSILSINPGNLSMKEILTTATRSHARHLSEATITPLLGVHRLTLNPQNPPRIVESDSPTRPLALVVPLSEQHGNAHFTVAVSATTGLIEIEDTSTKDNGQVLENNRSLRAKLATASVNDQKTRLADDLHRLLSAVIMEDVEDNLRQLGLYPVRRVALRTHDLAKTDLHPTSTVFVPLPVSQSHYFVSKVTQDGIAYELLKLLRVPMDNGGGLKMSVGDRIPIELSKLIERRKAKSQKRSLDEDGTANVPDELDSQADISSLCRFRVDSKDLRDMFYYCNALVAQTMVEQQLKDRGIPYTTHFPEDTDFPSPRSRSALAGMVPNLCVNASDLFKDGRTAEVAAPKVFLVINDWWKGAKCSVETIVRLRHRPSVNDTSHANVAPASSTAARAEGIRFDQATSTVRFRAPNVSRCVPDFLEQWERLSKVIIVAGDVNRLNKTEKFRDIRMLSFDLCTATLQYAPGYQVAITYTPTSDSYEASFFRSSAVPSTPAAPSATPAVDGEPSPHQLIAPLLSHHLNELTAQSPSASDALGSNGQQFIQLLRATLPLLLEVESLRVASATEYPMLVVRSVTQYRLVWDHEGTTRYALDATLTADSSRFLITDASAQRPGVPLDLTCGPLSTIPNLERAVAKGFQAARVAKVHTPGSLAFGTPAAMMTPGTVTAATPGKTPGRTPAAHAPTRTIAPVMPPVLRLDNGMSILCNVTVVQDVLRAMAGEIETAIASGLR
ncbi:mediator complex subunit [Vanrija albida]|uniref:Mediator of RNA polymerase II transcription subunit 14 n=1 Tax=Vanrija albida TaxID=181172 RepID=A0ABR3Q4J6_9TREE